MNFIYRIINNINQKIYIGQTNNPSLRWSQHKSNAKYNRGQQVITKALTKYGVENFEFEVIASCLDQAAADEAEEQIIIQYESRNPLKGYNVSAGGNTSPRTPESLQKISESLKKHYEEHDGWLKGKKLSKEWKENMSKAAIGKAGTNTGKKFSGEHRSKISSSHVGKILSDEHKVNLSKSHLGHIAANRKLTFEIAEEIRLKYKETKVSQKSLGIQYGLSQATIHDIIHNLTYKKVQNGETQEP